MSGNECNVCGLTDLPETVSKEWKKKVRKRSTRGKKVDSGIETSEETKWIACDSCKKWLHPFCGGLTEEEYKKIQGKVFYKCVACCLAKFVDKESKVDYKELVLNKIKKG